MAEHYLNLHRRHLEEADTLILKDDYVQASESSKVDNLSFQIVSHSARY